MGNQGSGIRGLASRFAALLLGLTIAVIGLELVLHLLTTSEGPPPPRVAVYEEHRTPVAGKPHMRYPANPPVDAETFRILVVGDSFTWGTGVYHDDVYGRRLESLLERMNRELDVELEVFGRQGWNTGRELVAVRREIGRLRPDLIVLGYCINDAEPNDREVVRRLLGPTRRRQPQGLLGGLLYGRSRLFGLVWERLENSRQKRAFESYYRRIYVGESWRLTQEAFDGFRQLAWDHNVPLVVAVFPVFDQQFDAGYSYAESHEKVLDALRQRDLPALDLLDAYRGIDTNRLAVIPFTDPHPNELAHRIASQHLAHYLVEQDLVPVTPEQRDRVELSLQPEKDGSE